MNDFRQNCWTIRPGCGPLVATAIHDGHQVRRDLLPWLLLSSEERLREEDPFTGLWTSVGNASVIVHQSRFEFDLNRSRDQAIYRCPEDAWGLQVWRPDSPEMVFDHSLALYETFYREIRAFLEHQLQTQDRLVLYDLHSYNHRRDGPQGDIASAEKNPEVNVGTGETGLPGWRPVVHRFIESLSGYDFLGRNLDVRENVKFSGGNFSRWVHAHFPGRVCVLAIEFKKFFMDEWTGKPDDSIVEEIRNALESTRKPVLDALSLVGAHAKPPSRQGFGNAEEKQG